MFSICASVNTYDPVETSVLFMIFIYIKKEMIIRQSSMIHVLCAIATCGAESAILSGAQEFNPDFSDGRSLVFCEMFCRSLFVLLSIVLSVLLRFTASDYLFGIFKLFLLNQCWNTDMNSVFLSIISS